MQSNARPSPAPPTVSVVVPTYNRARFLPEAIDSALGQSLQDLEVLVVDDGSTDETERVVREEYDDPRLRYFRQENQGPSAARNRGLAEARGSWIAFLDSDNHWPVDRLERQFAALEREPGVDVIYGDVRFVDEAGADLGPSTRKRYSGRITALLLRDNFVSNNTTLTRRRCFEELGGFDPALPRAQDYELWLRFSTRYRFLYLAEPLAYYRVMADQISSDKLGRFEANAGILEAFVRRYGGTLDPAELDDGLARFEARYARYLFRSGRPWPALRRIARGLRRSPLHPVLWRTFAGGLGGGLRRPGPSGS